MPGPKHRHFCARHRTNETQKIQQKKETFCPDEWPNHIIEEVWYFKNLLPSETHAINSKSRLYFQVFWWWKFWNKMIPFEWKNTSVTRKSHHGFNLTLPYGKISPKINVTPILLQQRNSMSHQKHSWKHSLVLGDWPDWKLVSVPMCFRTNW